VKHRSVGSKSSRGILLAVGQDGARGRGPQGNRNREEGVIRANSTSNFRFPKSTGKPTYSTLFTHPFFFWSFTTGFGARTLKISYLCMPNDGGFDVIDIARERRAGPEERRTTGGLPYRVSRTNTPDLGELRRELDRQRASAHRQGAGSPQRLRQACDGAARTCLALLRRC
jgi:hypothetical protein